LRGETISGERAKENGGVSERARPNLITCYPGLREVGGQTETGKKKVSEKKVSSGTEGTPPYSNSLNEINKGGGGGGPGEEEKKILPWKGGKGTWGKGKLAPGVP